MFTLFSPSVLLPLLRFKHISNFFFFEEIIPYIPSGWFRNDNFTLPNLLSISNNDNFQFKNVLKRFKIFIERIIDCLRSLFNKIFPIRHPIFARFPCFFHKCLVYCSTAPNFCDVLVSYIPTHRSIFFVKTRIWQPLNSNTYSDNTFLVCRVFG